MTPLMKLRLETDFGVSSIIFMPVMPAISKLISSRGRLPRSYINLRLIAIFCEPSLKSFLSRDAEKTGGQGRNKKGEKEQKEQKALFSFSLFLSPFLFPDESTRLVIWRFRLRCPVPRQLRCAHKVRHSPHWDQPRKTARWLVALESHSRKQSPTTLQF
jgi:hypothetical protein